MTTILKRGLPATYNVLGSLRSDSFSVWTTHVNCERWSVSETLQWSLFETPVWIPLPLLSIVIVHVVFLLLCSSIRRMSPFDMHWTAGSVPFFANMQLTHPSTFFSGPSTGFVAKAGDWTRHISYKNLFCTKYLYCSIHYRNQGVRAGGRRGLTTADLWLLCSKQILKQFCF